MVMDNAAIHKSKEAEQLIGKAGCELLFLPSYSPDLHPIEKTFGTLKKCRQFMPGDTTLDSVLFYIRIAISCLIQRIEVMKPDALLFYSSY